MEAMASAVAFHARRKLYIFLNTYQNLSMLRDTLISWLGGLTYEEAWEEMDQETAWLNSRVEELEDALTTALLEKMGQKKPIGRPRKVNIEPVKVE